MQCTVQHALKVINHRLRQSLSTTIWLRPDRKTRFSNSEDRGTDCKPFDSSEVVREVRVVAEDGALLDGVDGVDDVLRGERPDPLLVVLPDLEEGVLAALVGQRLDQVAVHLGRELVREVVIVIVVVVVVAFVAVAGGRTLGG